MVNPRARYSPIFDRPELTLPEGARVIVWPVINVEEWDINEPMARAVLPTPQNVNVVPDVANFGWFDYGLRIGFWRLKEVLDRHEIRATVSLNASICNSYPEIVRRSLDVGWEMLAHSFIQRVINKLFGCGQQVREHQMTTQCRSQGSLKNKVAAGHIQK